MSAPNSYTDIITKYSYNERNQILTQENPDGTIIKNSYDVNGNLVKRDTTTDGDTLTENFTYNSRGQLISATDARGNVANITYTNGLPTKISMTSSANDGETVEQNFTYDSAGFLTQMIDANGNISSLDLSAFHEVGKYTDAR
jgi:YD repeat-containing protein